MASSYFDHGNSEIEGGGGDGLQTLVLMNPTGYVGYSDNQPQQPPTSSTNFAFFHSNSFSHAPPPPSQAQHFVGVPLSSAAASPHQQDPSAALQGFVPRLHYNLYNSPVDFGAGREFTRSQQGLSLSLSSQQHPGYAAYGSQREVPSQPLATPAISPSRLDDVRASGGSPSSASGASNGVNGVQGVLLGSKYLKAAQELLDEVVNVGKVAKSANEQPKDIGDSSATGGNGHNVGGEGSTKRGAELTTAERQEIQMKKAKLVNMLDEVEQRYRQYYHQMQIVISWFEQAAGIGSAKTYTALALQTISKQFRCLKDAILGQIRNASKSLGEEESSTGKVEGSRLKYVDNQIRQQRALQQLGMIQHNAWRPQRGLPERSVSVLRAWLFEHFLHPYPKDSDKIMLAKQTGLSRSQVSNWFINARVRLWKPMVEEMYQEETKALERNGSEDQTGKTEKKENSASPKSKNPSTENQNRSFISKPDNLLNQNIASTVTMSRDSTSPTEANTNAGFNLIGLTEIEGITQGSPKKPRGVEILHSKNIIPLTDLHSEPPNAQNHHMSMKFIEERQGRDGFTFMGAPTNFIGGFGSYPIGELGRFESEQFQAPYSSNGVSLTLGLPQTFLPNQRMQLEREVEIGEASDFSGMNSSTSTRSTNVYESINNQNRKRFEAQLLPDFVT